MSQNYLDAAAAALLSARYSTEILQNVHPGWLSPAPTVHGHPPHPPQVVSQLVSSRRQAAAVFLQSSTSRE